MRTHIKYSCTYLYLRVRVYSSVIFPINILSFACVRLTTTYSGLYRYVSGRHAQNFIFLLSFVSSCDKISKWRFSLYILVWKYCIWKSYLNWIKIFWDEQNSLLTHFVQFRCQLPCRKTFVPPIFELVRRRHRPVLLIGPLYECTTLNIRWHKLLFIACPTPTPIVYYICK